MTSIKDNWQPLTTVVETRMRAPVVEGGGIVFSPPQTVFPISQLWRVGGRQETVERLRCCRTIDHTLKYPLFSILLFLLLCLPVLTGQPLYFSYIKFKCEITLFCIFCQQKVWYKKNYLKKHLIGYESQSSFKERWMEFQSI